MDLSIITVTWNSEEFIAQQIESVKKAGLKISYEHLVVDNASKDKTVEIIEKNYSDVVLIKNSLNYGFAAANNMALKQTRGEFVLFLNADVKLSEGSLAVWIDWMRKNLHIGITGCKLVTPEGAVDENLFPRRFPTWLDQTITMLKLGKIFPKILDRYFMRDFDPNREQQVDSVRGSCMLVRKELLKKTGWAFDPRYFIWFEDVDLCREAYKYGFKVVYTPVVFVYDYFGRSFQKNTNIFWKRQQFTKSMVQYFHKWEPWYSWISLVMIRYLALGFSFVCDCIVLRQVV